MHLLCFTPLHNTIGVQPATEMPKDIGLECWELQNLVISIFRKAIFYFFLHSWRDTSQETFVNLENLFFSVHTSFDFDYSVERFPS